MTRMVELSYTERLQVEELARQITHGPGIATIDLSRYQGGRGIRHRFREPLATLVGSPVEYGIDVDDNGERFGWFARREIDPEQQAARERLGFGG